MTRSKLLVVASVVLIAAVVIGALLLRDRFRCAGFPGPELTPEELPAGPAAPGRLRFVTWNIRNFPLDERPQDADLGFSRRTNICDLETAIGGLDADLLGLAEICDSRRFPPILRRAGRQRPYGVHFSAGGGRYGQHLALAMDRDRLTVARGPVELPELAMGGALRPGFGAYLRSTRPGGVDLSVLVVHLAAAPEGYASRLRQYRMIADWTTAWVAEVGDDDVVVFGDFNTTGRRQGGADAELALAAGILGAAGLERLANDLKCTEYWEGPGGPDGRQIPARLDHVWVRSLAELDRSRPAEVWLHCRRHGCDELISKPGAEDATFWDLSDHCPLSFEILDQDLD